MPPVTLSDVVRAASGRCVVLSAETAGYAVLALADQAVQSPTRASATEIELAPDGAMWCRHGSRCEDAEAASMLRAILSQLLSMTPGRCASLSSAARARSGTDSIRRFVGEVEAALIPVNRAAARRALARLHRETQRAKDQGRLVNVVVPAAAAMATKTTAPAPAAPPLVVEEAVEPLEEDIIFADFEPIPSLPPPPVITESTPRVADIESFPWLCKDFVPEEPPSAAFEEADIDVTVFTEWPSTAGLAATPFLGTVVTSDITPPPARDITPPPARDITPPPSQNFTDYLPHTYSKHDPPILTVSRPTVDIASLISTPPWPSADAKRDAATRDNAPRVRKGTEFFASLVRTPPMPLYERLSLSGVKRESDALDYDESLWTSDGIEIVLAPTPSHAVCEATPTPEPRDTKHGEPRAFGIERNRPWAAILESAPPAYEPRRSDVSELLKGFAVAETRTDIELSRELKRSIGMDLTPGPPELSSRTPPPVSLGLETSTSSPRIIRIPRPRSRRWAGGALALALVFTGLELRPTAATRAPANTECRAELVVRDVIPGSELRLRSSNGVEIRRVKVTSPEPMALSMLPCRQALELLVSERGDGLDPKWVRVGIEASQLTPTEGQNAVRRTISVR